MFVTEVVSIIFCCFPIRENKSVGKGSILRYFLAVTFSSYLGERKDICSWDIQMRHVGRTGVEMRWIDRNTVVEKGGWNESGGNTLLRYGSARSTEPGCCLGGLRSICFSLQRLWVILLERKCTKVLHLSNTSFWISGILKISVQTWDLSRCIDLVALYLAHRRKGVFVTCLKVAVILLFSLGNGI